MGFDVRTYAQQKRRKEEEGLTGLERKEQVNRSKQGGFDVRSYAEQKTRTDETKSTLLKIAEGLKGSGENRTAEQRQADELWNGYDYNAEAERRRQAGGYTPASTEYRAVDTDTNRMTAQGVKDWEEILADRRKQEDNYVATVADVSSEEEARAAWKKMHPEWYNEDGSPVVNIYGTDLNVNSDRGKDYWELELKRRDAEREATEAAGYADTLRNGEGNSRAELDPVQGQYQLEQLKQQRDEMKNLGYPAERLKAIDEQIAQLESDLEAIEYSRLLLNYSRLAKEAQTDIEGRQEKIAYYNTDEEYSANLAAQKAAEDAQQRREDLDPTEAAYLLEQLKAQRAEMERLYFPDGNTTPAFQDKETAEKYAERRDRLAALDAQIKQLEGDVNYRAEQAYFDVNYNSLANNEDFEKYSRYESTANGKGLERLIGGQIGETGYDDLLYELINGNQDAWYIHNEQVASGTGGEAPDNPQYALDTDKYQVYKQMTPEEVAIFNYLRKTDGLRSVEYLNKLEPYLNERNRVAETEYEKEYARMHPFLASLSSIAQAPVKGVAFVEQGLDLLDDGQIDENAPYNKLSYLPAADRAEVSHLLERNWGKPGSFSYQTGMSVLENLYEMVLTGGSAGEPFMLAVMGAGAAADGVIAAKDRGLNDAQAFALGITSGAVEAVTEKIGLDAFYDGLLGGKTAIRALLQSALAEGSEEIASTVLDDMADMIITGMDSERMRRIAELKAQGMSDSEAAGQAFVELLKEAGVAGLGGALSGLLMSGGAQALMNSYNAIQSTRESRQSLRAAENGLQALRDLGYGEQFNAELAEQEAQAPELAPGAQTAATEGTDTIPAKIAAESLQAAQSEAAQTEPVVTPEQSVPRSAPTTAEISGRDAAYLTMLGNTLWQNGRNALESFFDPGTATVSEYALEFMQVYNAELNGKETPRTITLSDAQIFAAQSAAQNDARASEQNTAAAAPQAAPTAAANVGFRDSTGTVSKETAAVLDTLAKLTKTSIEIDPNVDESINGEIVGNRITLQKASDLELIKTAKHEITHRLQELAPEAYKAYRDYAIYALSGNGDIDALVQKYQADYKTVGQNLSSDEAKDEIAADFTEALVVEAEKGSTETFANLAKHDERAARGIVQAIRDFIARLKEAFTGRQADTISRQTFGVGVAELERAAQLWDNLLEEGTRAAENLETDTNENAASEETAKYSPKDRYGNVIVENDVTPERVRAQLQSIYDNPKQNLDFTFPILKEAPFVYEYATEIPGTRSFVMNANKAAQAMLNRSAEDHNLGVDGLMQVIAKLGDPDYIVYQREGRNAGHYVAILKIDNGDAVAAVDLRNYRGDKNATVNDESGYYDVLISAYNKLDEKAAKYHNSFEDYVLSILDGNANDIVYDKEIDEEAMRVALSERLSGRAEAPSSNSTITPPGESVKGNSPETVSGVKYDTPAPAYNGTDTAVIETNDGKRRSLKSAREDLANFNWDTFKQGKMYKDLRTIDLGDEDIHALFDGIRGLVEYMTPNRGILDMNEETDKADRKYKPYKPNSDPLYKVSLDFSTLCRKRLMTQFIIEQLQLRENRSLTAEEQLTVRNMLIDYRAQDKALQVACAMCYVEAARLKSPKFINAYLDNPVPVIVDYMAKKSKSFDAQIRKRQADFKEAHGYARDTAKKNMSAADVNELNKLTPQWRQEYKPSEEEQRIIDYAKTLPNSTYLTAENLANLASGTPAEQTIYGAYTNYIREMTHSKGLETGVAYYYGDSKKVSAKRLAGFNAENGLRFDSWSDFQFEHMLDMMMAVIDLSTRKVGNSRGAKMHGYTKFPEMVRIFGKTGMMFNLSGVPEGNGFNEDGSLRFSGTESIDYDEAIKVRDQFPETAGMQCIGISDEHILALLESEVIDYIIPYHRSGMNAMLRKMAGIDNWTDYEGTQEAAVDKSIAFDSTKHDSKTWHKEPVFSEFFVGYDTGMSGIEAMRASAENYKRMCEERGLKPKFEKFTDNENYWKLLIDRKMINQKTGALIEQKAVRPEFDFDAIKTEIDRYVANYDPELQDRALEYITEHWQAEPTEQAAVLGNEAYAAQQRGVEGTPGARLSIKHGSGLEALQRENQRLRETVEELKVQTKPTTRRNVTVSNSDVRAAARNILKANESTLKAEDISAELKAIFEYVARDGEYVTERGEDGRTRTRREAMSYEGLMDKVRPLAVKITNSSRIMNSPEFQTWKAIDTFLYGKKIAMSALEQSRLPGGTAAAFNAANGRVKISTVGVPVAEAYKALRTMAGEDFFPADITTPEEQAVRISQVYAGLAPIAESPYSEGLSRANSVVADQIASEALDASNMISPITEALRQARAERVTTLKAERERFGEEMRAARADRDAALRQQHNELMTSKAEALRAVREDRDAKIQALKEHFREQNTLRRNAREMSAARQKLLKVVRRLQRIKTQAQYKAALNEIIGDIDTVAVGITGKHHADLVALRDEYAQMMKGLPDHLRNLALEEKLSRLEKRRIADMDIEEVRELTDILLGIENFLRNVGKPIANVNGTELSTFDSRDIYTQGLQVISDIQRSQGSKKTLWDWVVTNELTPERFARRITGYAEGNPLVNAVKGLSTGQRVMLDYQRRAYEQFKKFTADTKFMEEIRGKKAKTITVTGVVDGKATKLQITPDMRMALALHLLNRDNMKHIEGGGIIIPALDYLNKGDLAEAYARPQATISLSHDAVAEIVKGMTAKEIDYVNAAHAFLNSQSKTDINAVSEALMGWPVANVDNYFPINVSRDFTHSDYESLKRDGTIEGMGILKERVQSSLPIYLRGMTDVLNEAVRMQSKFVGLAIPVHNLSQLLNVTQLARPDATDVPYNTSVQSAIKEKWGARAGTYIERMLDDVQFSAPSTEELDSILGKIRSNYAGAVLSLNLSVAMKQAASYPTAAAELGWGPLLKALKSTGRVDLDLINKYTPVQWRRSNGFGTPELGDIRSRPDTLVNRILNTSFTTKSGYEVAPFNWIQTIDLLTTRKLWKASEYYVTENQPSLRHGTDDYYKAVAEVYNRVIEQTQPNYDVMQRPQLLRSKSSLVRTLAMFKTQPFQNFNILYDAIGAERVAKQAWEATGNEEAKAKYEEAKIRTKRAVGSSIVSAVVFATMTMLWNVLRRKRKYFEDKKGDVTVGSVVGKLATELAKNYAGQLIFGSEIYDAAEALFSGNQYNGIDSVSTSAISDAAGAVISFVRFLEQNVSDLAEGKRIDWDRTRVKLGDFASDMSKLFGIPMDNVQNLINATVRNTADIAVGRYMGEYTALRMTTPLSNTKAYYDLLYRAYRKSPNDFYELYYTLVGDGFSEDGIKSAMENRMKKDQGVSSVNDLRRRFEAP